MDTNIVALLGANSGVRIEGEIAAGPKLTVEPERGQGRAQSGRGLRQKLSSECS